MLEKNTCPCFVGAFDCRDASAADRSGRAGVGARRFAGGWGEEPAATWTARRRDTSRRFAGLLADSDFRTTRGGGDGWLRSLPPLPLVGASATGGPGDEPRGRNQRRAMYPAGIDGRPITAAGSLLMDGPDDLSAFR
ncbi:hypothetical protein NL676_008144 [Syzygium grande]|nr:hypothetical protein NL676_008144 [Syzygium grande]